MSFIEYLIDKGFIPYRKVYDKQQKKFSYVLDDKIDYFSSMAPGYCDIRLINKNNTEIIWGLHEQGHPPTLIYPRPQGINFDHQVDRMFAKYSYDEVFNMISNNEQRSI